MIYYRLRYSFARGIERFIMYEYFFVIADVLLYKSSVF